MCWLSKIFTGTIERPSPSDIIPEGNITIIQQPAGVMIKLTNLNIPFAESPKVWIPPIPDTNSMDPSMDFGHNNILITGVNETDHTQLVDFLKVGDIAVYRIMVKPADEPNDFSKSYKIYAIHRIVEIGKDNEGRYFKFRGDNNAGKDPYKARDRNILWVCIGTIF